MRNEIGREMERYREKKHEKGEIARNGEKEEGRM